MDEKSERGEKMKRGGREWKREREREERKKGWRKKERDRER